MSTIKAEDLIGKFQKALTDKWGYIWGTAGVKWTAEKQQELEKTTDSDRAQGRKYGSKWIGHMVADCSGLFKWAFIQLGGTMYHGSNTMYLKWCVDKGELKNGRRTDGKELKPGTAVFVWNGTKYSHVGLFAGGDTVIEAATTLKGVITSKVTDNKWTHWGELKGVDYETAPAEAGGQPPEADPADDALPTLRRGDKGKYVTLAQTKLALRGYSLGPCGIDGDFGKATESAVKKFQRDWDLTADGIIGPKTWAMLDTTPLKNETFTVTIPNMTRDKADELLAKYSGAYKEAEKG